MVQSGLSEARWLFQLSCFPGLVVGQNQQRREITGSFGGSLLAFLHSENVHSIHIVITIHILMIIFKSSKELNCQFL